VSILLNKGGGQPFRAEEFLRQLGKHARDFQLNFMVDGVFIAPNDVAEICEGLARDIEFVTGQAGPPPDAIEAIGIAVHRAELKRRRLG